MSPTEGSEEKMAVDEGRYRKLKDAGFSHQAALALADESEDEFGFEGGGGEAAPTSRIDVGYTTGSLDAGVSETGVLPTTSGLDVIAVQTDVPARVRLYRSTDSRDQDLERSITTDPAPSSGCMVEVATAPDLLTVPLNPVAGVYLDDSSTDLPITVTNLGDDAATVSVTVTYQKTEG